MFVNEWMTYLQSGDCLPGLSQAQSVVLYLAFVRHAFRMEVRKSLTQQFSQHPSSEARKFQHQ